MTNWLIILWIAVIILPTILLVLVPLIDKILTNDVIEYINAPINYIEYLIWSTNTTLLFWAIGVIIVMPLIRRFFSFFTWDNNK